MTTTIFLLTLVFFIQNVFCNDELLSKFHQHTYKLKDVRLQLLNYNKDLMKFFEIKPFKYNRTTTAHNVTMIFKVNPKDKLEFIVQANKFLSNEYRQFPMRFQLNGKKLFDANAAGLKALAKCGNITSFDFYKDITYHACNFVIDESHLPPLIPNGKYRLDTTVLFLNEEVALLYCYNEVYIPIKYPKK